MWKSYEYCDFICTWHCDHDLEFLSSYNCIQNYDTNDWKDEQNKLESENVVKNTPVVCSRSNTESELLEITSTCKSHHGVSVIGFNIVSEAKTLEVYSNLDGYLLTVKGHKLQLDESVDVITESIDIPVLYCCIGKLDKPTDCIILKFLGNEIREKRSVTVYRLHFYLHQNDTKSCTTQSGTGMIDMEKVKGYLHDMGDSVPENGTKLLHAVEDYQQTQMSRFGSFQALGSGNGSSFGLLASLLSTVTNRPSNDKDTKNNHIDNSKENNATLEQPSMGGGALSAMLKSMSGSQNGGQGDSQGQGQMFAMLQSICGKVGKLRVSEQTSPENEDQQEGVDTKSPEISAESDGDIEKNQSSKQTGIDIKMMQTVIEQTVSQMFETSEQKLKEYIDTNLNAMESRLGHKLDTLMEMLQNGNKQSAANSEDSH